MTTSTKRWDEEFCILNHNGGDINFSKQLEDNFTKKKDLIVFILKNVFLGLIQ